MYIVELYTTPTCKELIRELIEDLPTNQISKISRAIMHLKEFGISRNISTLRKLTGTKLWEYRILGKDNIRIICVAIINEKIVILNIFNKKSQKTPAKELKVSSERYKIVLDRQISNKIS